MESLYSAFVALVGEVPVGYEPVAYTIAASFAFYLVSAFFSFLVSLFRRW